MRKAMRRQGSHGLSHYEISGKIYVSLFDPAAAVAKSQISDFGVV